MITILLITNLTITMMFLIMKHPLSMGLMLLMQTIIVSLLSGNMTQNFWFSYILFIIMIGGMLILFMYMTSIASNEKFKTNIKIMINLIITVPTMTVITISLTNKMKMNELNESWKTTEFTTMLTKFINLPMMMMMMFMMMYLFLALIATVKITKFKQGSIRQMN
uniref:NADH-ubiquinone oxidoreductase chain 6 n=1 Tax=Cteniopinus ruber TaxID=2970659 RepID=A0A976YDE8_9CUCU|nr:NADH dehydrogenase subunit 6 [Cteniopinus ruber]UVF38388.1 NADH dehydrogenase subunit 6 [Cteniopinus ruber]